MALVYNGVSHAVLLASPADLEDFGRGFTLAEGIVADPSEIGTVEVPALVGLNQDLRDAYITDCQTGVNRWNRVLSEAGLPQRLYLPHVGFNRQVGAFAGAHIGPAGEVLTAQEWAARSPGWLPSDVDKTFVRSLMRDLPSPGLGCSG